MDQAVNNSKESDITRSTNPTNYEKFVDELGNYYDRKLFRDAGTKMLE